MRFGTFVVVVVFAVCAGVGVFYPVFGAVVFGALLCVVIGILALVTCVPVRRR